jgi:hypothetical protein
MKSLKIKISNFLRRLRVWGKPKIFCIGLNKTGTTSLKVFFSSLGYKVGEQHEAESLLNEVQNGNHKSLFKYIDKAQFFQDYPFSAPSAYKFLDQKYPDAKFILSVRNSPEDWYKSLVKFHSIKFNNGDTPTVSSLKNTNYIYKGWIWEFLSKVYGFKENEKIYDKDLLINLYRTHIIDVKEYFKGREDKLLIINLEEEDGVDRIYDFLNIKGSITQFPWENKTKE